MIPQTQPFPQDSDITSSQTPPLSSYPTPPLPPPDSPTFDPSGMNSLLDIISESDSNEMPLDDTSSNSPPIVSPHFVIESNSQQADQIFQPSSLSSQTTTSDQFHTFIDLSATSNTIEADTSSVLPPPLSIDSSSLEANGTSISPSFQPVSEVNISNTDTQTNNRIEDSDNTTTRNRFPINSSQNDSSSANNFVQSITVLKPLLYVENENMRANSSFKKHCPKIQVFLTLFSDLQTIQREHPVLRDILWLTISWIVVLAIESRSVYLYTDFHDDLTSIRISSICLLYELCQAYTGVGITFGFFGSPESVLYPLHTSSKIIILILTFIGKHRGLPGSYNRSVRADSFSGAPEHVFRLLGWDELRDMGLTKAPVWKTKSPTNPTSA